MPIHKIFLLSRGTAGSRTCVGQRRANRRFPPPPITRDAPYRRPALESVSAEPTRSVTTGGRPGGRGCRNTRRSRRSYNWILFFDKIVTAARRRRGRGLCRARVRCGDPPPRHRYPPTITTRPPPLPARHRYPSATATRRSRSRQPPPEPSRHVRP